MGPIVFHWISACHKLSQNSLQKWSLRKVAQTKVYENTIFDSSLQTRFWDASHESPKMATNAPKTAPRSNKNLAIKDSAFNHILIQEMRPKLRHCGVQYLEGHDGSPRLATHLPEDAPKMVQRLPQYGPKVPQDGLKVVSRWPREDPR